MVKIIAADRVAEVCSIYLARPGEILELFATQGLNPEAIHKTRLRIGEGLVGRVAALTRPLAVADVRNHPDFVYKEETREENFQSFLGVPILKSGTLLGVLVLQNKASCQYSSTEIESLLTIALVVGELIIGQKLVGVSQTLAIEGPPSFTFKGEGTSLNSGIAIGIAVLHQSRVAVHQVIADEPQLELRRLQDAVMQMHQSLEKLFTAHDIDWGGEHRDVLETYRMFAQDRGWITRIHEAIRDGLTAEAAVYKVQNDIQLRFGQVDAPYIRERIFDLQDVSNRLITHLAGDRKKFGMDSQKDFVLIARNMGPAELLDYDRQTLKALLLEEGSATAHVTIIARALDIPVISNLKGVLEKAEPGDQIIVDGDHGRVHIRPRDDLIKLYRDQQQNFIKKKALELPQAHLPAVTKNGTKIQLMLNAGLLRDVQMIKELGADGIGLFRTEIPFMLERFFPSINQQTQIYQNIIDHVSNKTIAFRTLDIGGDKPLPYFFQPREENPIIGWRASRITLDQPTLLKYQLRALIRAAKGRPVKVMFPMISEVNEFKASKNIFLKELEKAKANGIPLPKKTEIGVMLEVPSLLWQIDELCKQVDFLAIGSNDLFQFLYATDRSNVMLANRYDPLSPAFLRVLKSIVNATRDHKIDLSICGEMASQPLEAMTLLGLGFKTLSMAPISIYSIKKMTRSLDLPPFSDYLDYLLAKRGSEHSLRYWIYDYAKDHGVILNKGITP